MENTSPESPEIPSNPAKPAEKSLLAYVLERLPSPSEREALEQIARGAKVPYHTLLKIAKGQTADPRVSTVESLTRYFQSIEAV